jgi:hypothetical protein
MAYQLVVREAFGGYRKGDRIADATEVEKVLGGGNAGHVIRVALASGTGEAMGNPAAGASGSSGGAHAGKGVDPIVEEAIHLLEETSDGGAAGASS